MKIAWMTAIALAALLGAVAVFSLGGSGPAATTRCARRAHAAGAAHAARRDGPSRQESVQEKSHPVPTRPLPPPAAA